MSERVLPDQWETPRLRLRPFHGGDVEDVVAFASDEQWGRFLSVPRPYGVPEARAFLAIQLVADPAREPRWALEHEGRVVGSVELSLDTSEDGSAVYGALHFALARPLWGRGLASEAVTSVVDRAFTTLPELIRIASHADVRNVGSWRVMEKAGLLREGVLRSARVLGGERIDDVVYAVLREDWVARRGVQTAASGAGSP